MMNPVLSQTPTTTMSWLHTLADRNRVLFSVAAAHFILFLGMLIVAPFDARSVTGINPWIKPMKFALSIAIYTATIGWFLGYLPITLKAKQRVSWGIAIAMLVEMALIALQAARGVPSHFNETTSFNVTVFRVMGAMIVGNTVLVAYVTWQFYRTHPALPAPLLWGIRLGMTLFILASLEGFAMIGRMSHGVGVADGGPGLPFVNWSTEGGDLRLAHFIGMHALQVIPVVGSLLSRPGLIMPLAHPVTWVWVFTMGYAAASLSLFLLALSGQPLLRLA